VRQGDQTSDTGAFEGERLCIVRFYQQACAQALSAARLERPAQRSEMSRASGALSGFASSGLPGKNRSLVSVGIVLER